MSLTEFEDITYFLTKFAKIAVYWSLTIIKFSDICVRFMYKYFFPFFNSTPFVFSKDISCYYTFGIVIYGAKSVCIFNAICCIFIVNMLYSTNNITCYLLLYNALNALGCKTKDTDGCKIAALLKQRYFRKQNHMRVLKSNINYI